MAQLAAARSAARSTARHVALTLPALAATMALATASAAQAAVAPTVREHANTVCSDIDPHLEGLKVESPAAGAHDCYDDDDRGRLTIVKRTPPGEGYDERFAFRASHGLEPAAFTLAGGEVIELRPEPGTYTVEETATEGWKVGRIACDDGDSTGHGRTATIVVDRDEKVTCTFYNERDDRPQEPAPPAPTPPAVAPPARVPAQALGPALVAVRPASAVKGTTARSATASLRRLGGCASRAARVAVSGSPIRLVVFSVDGRRARTVVVPRGQRRLTVTLPIGSGRVHRVTARVTFGDGSRSRTLATSVVRCAEQEVAPQFTG